MRRPFRQAHYQSFTLVELLVVIAIIAILASVLLAAGTAALRASLRAKAGVMASQIQVACSTYYTDYGTYPIPSSAVGTQPNYGTADLADWGPLIYALCGNIDAATPGTAPTGYTAGGVTNSRNTVYLQLNRSSIDPNGIPVNPISPSSTASPYFNIILDGAYSGILTNVPVFSPGSMTSSNNMPGGVYVWANCNSATGGSNVNFWVHAP